MTTCNTCSSAIPDPAEEWPDGNGGTICQECWEKECSLSWWVMVRALGKAGLLDAEEWPDDQGREVLDHA
jgi:hypothetical protein